MWVVLAVLQIQLVGIDDETVRRAATDAFESAGFVVVSEPVPGEPVARAFAGVEVVGLNVRAIVLVFEDAPFRQLGVGSGRGVQVPDALTHAVWQMRRDVNQDRMVSEPPWVRQIERAAEPPDDLEGIWVGGRGIEYAAVVAVTRKPWNDVDSTHLGYRIASTDPVNNFALFEIGEERGILFKRGRARSARVRRPAPDLLRVRGLTFHRIADLPVGTHTVEVSEEHKEEVRRARAQALALDEAEELRDPGAYVSLGYGGDAGGRTAPPLFSGPQVEVALQTRLRGRIGTTARYAYHSDNHLAGLYVNVDAAQRLRFSVGAAAFTSPYTGEWKVLPAAEVRGGRQSQYYFVRYLAGIGSALDHFQAGGAIYWEHTGFEAGYAFRPTYNDLIGNYFVRFYGGQQLRIMAGLSWGNPAVAQVGVVQYWGGPK